MNNLRLGNKGEDIAYHFLIKKGYRILERNYHTHWGELDLITLKNQTLIFFEIKTRTSFQKGQPYEAVNLRKLIPLKRAINYYLLTNKYSRYKLRLDVITIFLQPNTNIPHIKHYENVEMS